MKIEIWSDFACPYCYIGKRKIEEALKDFPMLKDVHIVFKSFELDPTASTEVTMSTKNRLMNKYDMSELKAQQMMDSITEDAANAGLDIHYETASYTNTFDAHRLLKYAQSECKEKEIVEKLFHAYFIDNKKLSDFNVLLNIASEIGLDKKEVERILNSNKFVENVRIDEKEAQRFGIRSVPFFVINQKYAISGAQPPEVFKKAIKKVLEESNLSCHKEYTE